MKARVQLFLYTYFVTFTFYLPYEYIDCIKLCEVEEKSKKKINNRLERLLDMNVINEAFRFSYYDSMHTKNHTTTSFIFTFPLYASIYRKYDYIVSAI